MSDPEISPLPHPVKIRLHRRIFRRKRLKKLPHSFLLIILFIGFYAHLTNQFLRWSAIPDQFRIIYTHNQLDYRELEPLMVVNNPIVHALANAKTAWHILSNRLSGGGVHARETTIENIIDSIHWLRFNTQNPFLISGDHFVELYPRSLGIFYHSTLDPRTARNQVDWINRQAIYLKTTIYALATFQPSVPLTTTIIPFAPHAVTTVNYFSPPSDTLYSILFAIDTLGSSKELTDRYPFERIDNRKYVLNTQDVIAKIRSQYHQTLVVQYERYVQTVVDPTTGLIKKTITLSSTKDSVRRQSAFYDNVILWKTIQLAQQLGVTPKNDTQLSELKQKIITTFWLPKEGYFVEDLSSTDRANHAYSSDWLIAFMTGFLDPDSPTDRQYLVQSMEYIRNQKLDRPFALKYQSDRQQSNLYLPLKIGAPNYATHAIWSNWGMEYIKLLLRLYQETCNHEYLTEANYQIQKYSSNITKYRGYLEVYDKNGQPFHTLLYTSVYQTGWVVSFEEARAMLSYVSHVPPITCN